MSPKNHRSRRLLYIPLLLASLPTIAANSVTGRYVRVLVPGYARIISLAEVQVFNNNNVNIATNGRAIQSSTAFDAAASRAIDNRTTGDYFLRSTTHSNSERNPWWELDLGSDKQISSIKVFNRTDCCSERLKDARLIVLNAQRDIVWATSLDTVQPTYTYVTTDATDARSRLSMNLLRNADFALSSNGDTPDNWDIHNAAKIEFETIYSLYQMDRLSPSPLPGASVVRVENPSSNFYHFYLFPQYQFSTLPTGPYTYSVYLKSQSPGTSVSIFPSLGDVSQSRRFSLTTNWVRYTATFTVTDNNQASFQPTLVFSEKGSYYVSAPQLEFGNYANDFGIAYEESQIRDPASLVLQKSDRTQELIAAMAQGSLPKVNIATEFDKYLPQSNGRLILKNYSNSSQKMTISCSSLSDTYAAPFYTRDVQINPMATQTLSLQIAFLPEGKYKCQAVDKLSGPVSTTEFSITTPVSTQVRFNRFTRTMDVSGQPYHLRGVGIYGHVPALWFFNDLKRKGINTIIYFGVYDGDGRLDRGKFDTLLGLAQSSGINVVLASPIMGAKPSNFGKLSTAFLEIVRAYIGNMAILGWYLVDEPASSSWSDSDLISFYRSVRDIDPNRLVLNNWAFDAIPESPGSEPRGTLRSSDLYSVDYYPNMGWFGIPPGLEQYTALVLKVLQTARYNSTLGHSWLQLYGGPDVWREATVPELRYMAYLNLLYGSPFSYFSYKSSSQRTWNAIERINLEAQFFMENLFWDASASEVKAPSFDGAFLTSTWKKGDSLYVIVVHPFDRNDQLNIDVRGSLGRVPSVASTVFESQMVTVSPTGTLMDSFGPFEVKAYTVK